VGPAFSEYPDREKGKEITRRYLPGERDGIERDKGRENKRLKGEGLTTSREAHIRLPV